VLDNLKHYDSLTLQFVKSIQFTANKTKGTVLENATTKSCARSQRYCPKVSGRVAPDIRVELLKEQIQF
jgi:hypothetical protein